MGDKPAEATLLHTLHRGGHKVERSEAAGSRRL